jgi:hypothetical protein
VAGYKPRVTRPRVTAAEEDIPGVDAALPTFVVVARFRRAAADGAAAERALRQELADAQYDDVQVERADDDGTWLLRGRFVVVSIDGHTALTGVHETLHDAGTEVEEVWLDRQLP